MNSQVFLYSASLLVLFWGVAHLFPTRSVVAGFGEITRDNQRIIAMEWIGESLTLIFISAVVFAVTYIDHTNGISRTIYWLAFAMLNAMSLLSLFTGFRIRFLPFKLCPVIFTLSSILILLGGCI